METFKYQELDIKYIQAGAGEPLIFLHNGGTSHIIWKNSIDELSKMYKVYAIDLLGYGSSSKPETGYELGNHVAILTNFILEHQLKNVTLIGNCMGSSISLVYAKNNPTNVRALILVNPLTYNTFAAGRLGSFLRLRKSSPNFSQSVYKKLGGFRVNNFISEKFLRLQFGSIGKSKHIEKSEELKACFTAEGQMHSLLWTLDDLVNYSFLDDFLPPENFPPICTIWGLENKILAAKAGKVLNENLKPKREEWLEKGGHLVPLEAPGKIAEIIHSFIANK